MSNSQNNSASNKDKHTDKFAPAHFDVADPSGKSMDVSDKAIDQAQKVIELASKGTIPKVKTPLTQRVSNGEYTRVEDDPFDLPHDTETNNEENMFQDEDTIQGEINIEDESSVSDIVPSTCGPTCQPQPIIKDSTTWIINALKTIHEDIQTIKPLVNEIPIVDTKVREIQIIIGAITGEMTEINNRMENIEKTITINRLEINKLIDLFKTHMTIPHEAKQIQQKPATPKPISIADTNITKLVEAISKKKNLTGDQEMTLRNLIINKDRDIILTSMKDLGIRRPIMSAELDIILQADHGLAKSMSEVLKVLVSLIPERPKEGCSIDCSQVSDLTPLSRSVMRRANPFQLNQ